MSTVLDLIKSSKIIQIGILFILLSISVAIINSDKISLWGLEVETEEIIDHYDSENNQRFNDELIHPDELFKGMKK